MCGLVTPWKKGGPIPHGSGVHSMKVQRKSSVAAVSRRTSAKGDGTRATRPGRLGERKDCVLSGLEEGGAVRAKDCEFLGKAPLLYVLGAGALGKRVPWRDLRPGNKRGEAPDAEAA